MDAAHTRPASRAVRHGRTAPGPGRRGVTGAVVAACAAVAVLALSGCGGHGGSSPAGAGQASVSAAPSGLNPSVVREMQRKVDAAQSAANAADSDAASDPH